MIEYFANNFTVAILVFSFGALLVAVLSTAMSKAAITLRDKAHLPEGVIGGLLIGIITSIPELISGIFGVINYAQTGTHPGSSVFGDAVGSNMFCLFALAVVLLICIKMFVKREVNQTNTFTVIFIIIGTIFCFLACVFDNNGIIYHDTPSPLVWNGFNFFSILILASYAAAVFFMIFGSRRVKAKAVVMKGSETQTILPSSQKKKKKSWFNNVSIGVVIFLFVMFAIFLIISSLFLAYSCEGLIVHWNLGQMFGRTLLLGITTSLPELISIINLVIDKEYNMAVDSTVGSCGFNLTILFISNVAYACVYNPTTCSQQSMFALDQYSIMQLVLFLFESILILAYIVANSQSIKQYLTKRQVIGINATLLSMVSTIYIIYIALGFIYP